MSSLAHTQRLLWALITAPEGVAKALTDDSAAGGVQRRELARTVRSDGRLDAVTRLDIYANMYFYRLLDVLKDDYPALVAVMGDTAFHNLVTDYLLRHFPTHPSLRYAGAHLANFIAHHPLVGDYPFIADVAAFEWALVESFDALEAPVLSADDLRTVPPAAWADLRFRLHPSVQLRSFGWQIHSVRQCVDAGDSPPIPDQTGTHLRIWRRDNRVRYQTVEGPEWQALQTVASGGTFAAACAAATADVDPDDGATALAANLARWVGDGLFSSVDTTIA